MGAHLLDIRALLVIAEEGDSRGVFGARCSGGEYARAALVRNRAIEYYGLGDLEASNGQFVRPALGGDVGLIRTAIFVSEPPAGEETLGSESVTATEG
jgi:hypothetical protein